MGKNQINLEHKFETLRSATIRYPLSRFNIRDLEGIPLRNKCRIEVTGKNKNSAKEKDIKFEALLTDKTQKKIQSYKKFRPSVTTDYNEKLNKYIMIYSDGGVFNHGYSLSDQCDKTFGAVSCVIINEKGEKLYAGAKLVDGEFTSNELEVYACLLGLRWLFKNNIGLFTEDNKTPIIVNTDSEFLFSCITDRSILDKNVKRCIRRTENNNVWNENLKILLTELSYMLTTPSKGIYGSWVRSHSRGNDNIHDYNILCDVVCNMLINKHLDDINMDDTKKRRISDDFKRYMDMIEEEE